MRKSKVAGVAPKSSHISFDSEAYMMALHRAIIAATKEVSERLLETTYNAAASLPFKDNEVKLAGGKVTSDRARKMSLLRSIVKEQVRWISQGVAHAAVHALGKDFANSHIGLYYEYGTGEMAVKDLPEPEPNPYRTGSTIVTRSKHAKNTVVEVRRKQSIVHTKGVWRDLGGNLRITNSPRGGDRDAGFVEAVGEDVSAHLWFAGSFHLIRDEVLKTYREAMSSVHPAQFMHLSAQIEL